MNTTHCVTPYGTKYGQHPKFFNFDRNGEMRLTDAGVAEEMRSQERRALMDAVEDTPD